VTQNRGGEAVHGPSHPAPPQGPDPASEAPLGTPGPRGARGESVALSSLILCAELACIRWFPAHVLFLTFFTNTVLLSVFLGMSVGLLAARHKRNYLPWSGAVLALALALGHGVEALRVTLEPHLDVGGQLSPQLVFFGAEYYAQDVAQFLIPIEVINGFFFALLALVFIGPGQELGRALSRVKGRVEAYTFDILGSLSGIALFAAASWMELSPVWWFAVTAIGLGYFLKVHHPDLFRTRIVHLVVVVALAAITSSVAGLSDLVGTYWSPYYRIDYEPIERHIRTNLIGHQTMVGRADPDRPAIAYALPHILNRDTGGEPFKEVLIIGAGSGNDVSRALQWGAEHIDAVEIDPVIQRLGVAHHPDRPYDDPRVSYYNDDGRNFLRRSDTKYDLIIYALVDSLVLHSSQSNIRLESYLFTREAMLDVERNLKPDGVFVMYNFFRQGWIVGRLDRVLEGVYGERPLVLTLPWVEKVEADRHFDGFTLLLNGDIERIRGGFETHGTYWMRDEPVSPTSPNGFALAGGHGWHKLAPPTVEQPVDRGVLTDDWPFLYLRGPMVPALSLRSALLMGAVALLLIWALGTRRRVTAARTSFDGRMFFLGAGFMLIETKAVVHMALLFGSTWMVNTVVFFSVLVTILVANLYVLRFRPEKLWPYYALVLAALAVNAMVPLHAFLGMDRIVQIALSSALVFAPVVFAGVIFATAFSRTREADRAFGANIGGAMVGGLTEYTSMLLGFSNLMLVAMVFYALSAWARPAKVHGDPTAHT